MIRDIDELLSLSIDQITADEKENLECYITLIENKLAEEVDEIYHGLTDWERNK